MGGGVINYYRSWEEGSKLFMFSKGDKTLYVSDRLTCTISPSNCSLLLEVSISDISYAVRNAKG